MIVRYEYRCPRCGKTWKQDVNQDFEQKDRKEIIKICSDCRVKK